MDVIQLNQVSFQYVEGFALCDVSFRMQKGEIFALLGPNGAGKTTTIRLVNGLLNISSGNMKVLGYDPYKDGVAVRRKTGVLTETPALYERLTAVENLTFFGKLNGMNRTDLQKRIQELLDYFDLSEHADQRVGTYSRGMRQRLAIARALLHHPELLFLDEPTSNLDPEIARQVQDLILRVKKEEGCSVVICTHRLHEAEQICDHAAIMHQGKMLAEGSLQELREASGLSKRVRFTLREVVAKGFEKDIACIKNVKKIDFVNEKELLLGVSDYDSVPEILTWMIGKGIAVLSVVPEIPSLEEVYFKLQNHNEVEREY